MGAFGYEQTVKYEVARDLLNGRRAALSAELDHARGDAAGDGAAVDRIQAAMRSVAESIRRLDVADEAALDAVIAANRSGSFASVA